MNKTSEITVTRKGAHIGAAVSGVDFSRPQSKKNRQAIADALMEHEVLVFPEIDISLEEQAAFSK
jgi:taurine dioxygenase